MTIVAQFSWDDIASPDFGTPARQAWRAAVAEIAEKAKATLPQCNGRVEKAAALVLAGDVELLEDGKAKVASQSNGQTTYFVVNGTCECRAFAKAPSGWCKHRIAAGMQKRALALAKAMLEAGANGQADAAFVARDLAAKAEALSAQARGPAITPAPASQQVPCPEAAFSLCLKGLLDGVDAQLTVRGQTATDFLANLQQVRDLLTPYSSALSISSLLDEQPVRRPITVPRRAPERTMEVILPAHRTARFAGLYAQRTAGDVLRSARV